MAVRPASYLSAFSGIGALDLAVGRVFRDARPLVYVENEATAVLRLAANMEAGRLHPAPVWSDIRTLPTGELRGRTDLVVGGFPCQDLSNAGRRAGIHGERSGLFFDLIRAVCDIRPRYLFLENVAALTVGGLDTVLGTLAEVGFDARWGCLRASDVGAPHGRDRWWCLAWDRQQLADAHGQQSGADGRRSDTRTNGRHDAGRRCSIADAELGHPCRQGLAAGGCIGRDDGPQLPAAQRAGGPLGDPCRQRSATGLPAAARGHGIAAEPAVADDAGDKPLPDAIGGRQNGWAHETERRPLIRTAAEGAGEPLGDAERPEWRSSDVSRGRAGERLDGSREAAGRFGQSEPSLPLWPPGPADGDGWRYVLERWPYLAPAVEPGLRRVADERAHQLDVCVCSRGDRLRGLGNAVVVSQAEAALRLLWRDAFGEWL